jgi:LPXTG-site transpeptidase (sortase) family protein
MPARTDTPLHNAATEFASNASRPRRSRGPLLLFLVGALASLTIVAVQLLGVQIPGLSHVPGFGGHAANAQRPTAAGAPVVHNLEELRSKYGDPKDATYGRMRIPSLHIDAPIGKHAVGKDGQLPDPEGPGDVAWYDFGSNKTLGGVPGGGGNAVFAGHVDRNGYVDYAGVQYLGPAVFFSLDQLAPGDVIEVASGAKTLRYSVVWAKQVPADADWSVLLSSKVLGDSITVVTCGGEFNYDTHEYTNRLVVRAVRG